MYESVLGAEVLFVARFSEAPPPLRTPGDDDLIFHATLQIGETRINLSDDPKGEHASPDGFALLVHVDEPNAVDRIVDGLSESGKLMLEPAKTPWARRYGIAEDPFGIIWKIQYS